MIPDLAQAPSTSGSLSVSDSPVAARGSDALTPEASSSGSVLSPLPRPDHPFGEDDEVGC